MAHHVPRSATAAALIAAALASGCISKTIVRSEPPGAIVKEGDAFLGRTPVVLWSKRTDLTVTQLTVEEDGYLPATLVVQRSEWDAGSIVMASIFCPPATWWIANYQPEYSVTLVPFPGLTYSTSGAPTFSR